MSKKYTNTLLKIAANRLSKKFDAFAKEFDTTWMQMSVIDFVSRRKDTETFQRDIEIEFFIQRSTATVLLQRMEKKNLLYRQSSKTDARQKSVYLTDKALALEERINDYMQHQQELLSENFSPEEITQFEKMLNFFIDGGND
ncbi:MarR family transcriptional regulator [Companilactobacillus musae]|jgi:Transcriptional regulators|uniref:MarR family winged helix-turn-helix transcriptional regulator n=1 Tax=Companilactobacillus musae TaxID=1903258 RepID=UPI000E65836B|nr:MarR family transcriptional regulator [Companilactobacillus musae]